MKALKVSPHILVEFDHLPDRYSCPRHTGTPASGAVFEVNSRHPAHLDRLSHHLGDQALHVLTGLVGDLGRRRGKLVRDLDLHGPTSRSVDERAIRAVPSPNCKRPGARCGAWPLRVSARKRAAVTPRSAP